MVFALNEDKRIKVEVLSYQQGWFSSRAKLRITLFAKSAGNAQQLQVPELHLMLPISFLLQGHIKHGPLMYSPKLHSLVLGYAYLHGKFFVEKNIKETMKVDLLAAFNETWNGRFYTALLAFPIPGFQKISLAGVEGKFLFILNGEHLTNVKGSVQTGAVLIEGDANNSHVKAISIEPLKGRYDTVHEQKGLWSGSMSIFTPGMIITQPDQANFIIKRLAINSTFSFGESILYNANLAIFANSIISPSYTLPAFSKFHARVSAKNLSTKGINDYIQVMKTKTPEEIKNIDLVQIENLLSQTIQQTSTLNGLATADSSLGTFTAHSKTNWPANIPLPRTLDEVYKNSFTEIKLKMTKQLVVKLLSIYGDEIMATSEKQLEQIKLAREKAAKQYFQNQRTADDNAFKQKVEQLLQNKLISTSLSLQLLAFQKEQQSIETFSLNLTQLNVAPEIKKELESSYSIQDLQLKQMQLNDKINNMINDLMAISYLKKDNDDYLSEIIIENGIFKINGGPIVDDNANTP